METPLALWAAFLCERHQRPRPELPPEREAEGLREVLRSLPLSRREREISEYLDRASRGGRAPGTRGGSLKNLLWTLRDRAGELYPALARALFARLLGDPDLPLDERLAARLARDPVLGPWAQMVLEGADWRTLADLLQVEEIGKWRVVFNPTPLNLLAVAARMGVGLYAAASDRGAALKALEGFPAELLDRIAARAGGRWVAPYPDLRVCREDPPGFPALYAAVRAVLAEQAPGPGQRAPD